MTSKLQQEDPSIGLTPMFLFKWRNEHGQFVACARNVIEARSLLMAKLPPTHPDRHLLAAAISSVPTVSTDLPHAAMVFNQTKR